MKKYLVLVWILAAIASSVSGQAVQNAYNLNYIPPSPSAAALGKFGEYPVSLSTGVPSISVPMFSYKGINNGLSLDISLAYHAGGIRVEEIASNVGTGWALNAGGVITRTVRSLPDDYPGYGYLSNYPLPNPTTAVLRQKYVDNAIDGEQDEFNFNFNGHSGKFILDGSRNPILISKAAIKIKPLYSAGGVLPFTGFVITDETGVKYMFRDIETTSASMGIIVGTISYASSYYLSSIINPLSRDTISFTYNTASSTVFNFGSESSSNNKNISGVGVSPNTVYAGAQGTSATTVAKRIKTIRFPDRTELNFLYNSLSRCDLSGDSTLVEVRKKNSQTGQFKRFKLYQSYIDALGIKYNYSPSPCASSTTLRLRLDSVQESGLANSAKPYKFVYNDAYNLPDRNSPNQDFWGFYNGTLNTSGHLVPQLLIGSYMLSGADRRCDSNAVGAGTLTKIIYPTGGYSQFDYEANRAGDNLLIFHYLRNNNVSISGDSHTKSFTISRPDPVTIKFDFNMTFWCPGTSTDCQFVYKIKSSDDATTYATQTFNYSELNTVKSVALSLPNGTYHLTWEFATPATCSCSDQFGFNLSYYTFPLDSTQMGSGVRIKKITNYDGISHANDMIKQYRYVKANGTSSGYAAVLPEFIHDYGDCVDVPGDYRDDNYTVRTATTNSPLTFSTGGINYDRVEVINTGPSNQGKEVNYFTSYKTYGLISNEGNLFAFPFTPLQSQDWNLGLLTQQETYDSSNHLLKKSSNIYQNIGTTSTDTLTNFKVGISYLKTCDNTTFPTRYVVNGYNWIISHSDRVQTTTVDYTPSGDSLVTKSFYTYDPAYFTLSKEVTVDSKKDTISSFHYYPFNYSISGSVFTAMRDSNMIARPVSNEIWKYLSGKYYLIDADATNYAQFNQTYLPQRYYRLNAVSPVDPAIAGSFSSAVLLRSGLTYDQKINFSSYDSKANPLLLYERGKRTAYVWDINKEFPIAKVINADSLSVAYTSFEADGSGNWTIPSSVRDTTTAITGKKCYNLGNGSISIAGLTSSKTYIVSYWSKNGSYTLTNGGTPKTGVTLPSGWTYYEHQITGTTSITASGSGRIDELRLYPLYGQMNTVTYDPLVGATSTADAKNGINYYQYDGLLRLINVIDQNGKIIKHTDYHYQNQ